MFRFIRNINRKNELSLQHIKTFSAMGASVLSNMQKELLKLYATDIPDEQLLEIKLLLSNYFADKATSEIDKLWDKNNWSEKTMDHWTNEHNRSKSSHRH